MPYIESSDVIEFLNGGEGNVLHNKIAESLLQSREEISKLKSIIWLVQRCAEAGEDASRPLRLIEICKPAWDNEKEKLIYKEKFLKDILMDMNGDSERNLVNE